LKASAPARTGVGNSLENCQFKTKICTHHFFTSYSPKQQRDENFYNNFKRRAEAKRIFMAMFPVGNGGENPLRHWKRRPEFVVQF